MSLTTTTTSLVSVMESIPNMKFEYNVMLIVLCIIILLYNYCILINFVFYSIEIVLRFDLIHSYIALSE